ncbi:MAG: hypothetical protein ACYC6M_03095 [Terriglobales bacterium]
MSPTTRGVLDCQSASAQAAVSANLPGLIALLSGDAAKFEQLVSQNPGTYQAAGEDLACTLEVIATGGNAVLAGYPPLITAQPANILAVQNRARLLLARVRPGR